MPTIKASDANSIIGSFTPPGVVQPFAGATIPAGWLLCDGSSKLISDYPALAVALYDTGTSKYAWGSADGSHFNLPDLRGRFLRGRNVSGSEVNEPSADVTARTVCNTGGNTGGNVGSVQIHTFKDHGHPMAGYAGRVSNAQDPIQPGAALVPTSASWQISGSNMGVGGTGDVNSGTESRPVNAYVNYIIKY